MSPRRSGAATRAQTRVLSERVPEIVDGLLAGVARPAKPYGRRAMEAQWSAT